MLRTLAAGIVAAHLAVSLIHGAAHSGAPVPLSAFQNAFVWIVILAGPLIALWMVWTGRALGPELFLLTMAGSLVFGVVNHFVIESADHVSHVTSATWRLPFQVTAVALAVLEAAGTAVGIRCWRRSGCRYARFRSSRSALSTRARASSKADELAGFAEAPPAPFAAFGRENGAAVTHQEVRDLHASLARFVDGHADSAG